MSKHPNTIVVGLGFGDEAKGATIAHLAATTAPAAVVRFSGGAQTAHNVIHDGRHHTFRLFGSGTLTGARTYLSRHVIVDPEILAQEMQQLRTIGVGRPEELIEVSPHALVSTMIHRAVNRVREDQRGNSAHGSCGLGVGETRWYHLAQLEGLRAGQTLWGITTEADTSAPALTAGDCRRLSSEQLLARLIELADFYSPLLTPNGREISMEALQQHARTLHEFGQLTMVPDAAYLVRAADHGHLLFEGSQGVLLDEWRGFHPHTTWSTTLPSAAQELLDEAGLPPATVVGALRAYTTRHGYGPMPTENESLLPLLPESHNDTGRYQGAWRVGDLDLPLIDYAARVCRAHGGLDALAVSHLDMLDDAGGDISLVRSYLGQPEPFPLGNYRDLNHQAKLTAVALGARPVREPIRPADATREIATAAGAPLAIAGFGPDTADRVQLSPLTARATVAA